MNKYYFAFKRQVENTAILGNGIWLSVDGKPEVIAYRDSSD